MARTGRESFTKNTPTDPQTLRPSMPPLRRPMTYFDPASEGGYDEASAIIADTDAFYAPCVLVTPTDFAPYENGTGR